MVCVYGGTFAQFQYASDFNESCRQGVGSLSEQNNSEIKIGNIMEVNQKRCVSKMRMVYFCKLGGDCCTLLLLGRETLPFSCEFDLV